MGCPVPLVLVEASAGTSIEGPATHDGRVVWVHVRARCARLLVRDDVTKS